MLTPTMHLFFAAAALVFLLLIVPFSSAGNGHPSLHAMKKFKQDWPSYHSTITRRRIPTTTTKTTTSFATAAATTTTTTSKSTEKKKKFQKQQLQLIPRAGGTATTTVVVMKPFSYYLRVAFAGGVAGATGTAVLYPMDSAKTLRQSNPNVYKSVRSALMELIRSPIVANNNSNNMKNKKLFQWHISRAYKGIVPAALGAIPSSALYFGAYESSKIALSGLLLNNKSKSNTKSSSVNNNIQRRLLVHGLAAASGNTISSAIFVPKEVIKQQLQQHAAATKNTAGATSTGRSIVMKLIQEKGIRGLYAGYQATLMRNIPSAILRFVLYEELKRKWGGGSDDATTTIATDSATTTDPSSSSILPLLLPPKPVRLFAAGAVAGAFSSGFMTPIDVIKTRMATGTCPLNVQSCFLHVIKEAGWNGLYAGAGSRMMWSGAFSAIGFGTFEFVKQSLGVASSPSTDTN